MEVEKLPITLCCKTPINDIILICGSSSKTSCEDEPLASDEIYGTIHSPMNCQCCHICASFEKGTKSNFIPWDCV